MEQYANLISFHGESHCFFSGQNKNIIQRKDKYRGFSGSSSQYGSLDATGK